MLVSQRRTVSILKDASELHDLGKIGIADSILLKPGEKLGLVLS